MSSRTDQTIELEHGRIAYELLGDRDGRPIVLTPGGRFGKDVPGLRPLAQALADGGMRVLLWDRPGCGASDVQLCGETESHMRADVLAELLVALGLAPCMAAGGSGGARDSLLTAILHPQLVSKLAIWNVTGGIFGVINLAAYYLIPSMNAVRTGGIDGVIALPEWRELIAASPRSEEVLRELGAEDFWRVMLRWMDAYVPKPGQTIPGVKDMMFERITAPTMIIRGGERDPDHPKRTSYEVHSLIPQSTLVEPPWPEDSWERSMAAEIAGTGHLFDAWQQAAPLILQFAAER